MTILMKFQIMKRVWETVYSIGQTFNHNLIVLNVERLPIQPPCNHGSDWDWDAMPVHSFYTYIIQGSTKRRALGLVNFVPALAYHFCLNLPAAFTQPGARHLVEPCTLKPQITFRC